MSKAMVVLILAVVAWVATIVLGMAAIKGVGILSDFAKHWMFP